MSAPASGRLYSRQLLALAVELADYPYDPLARLQGEAVSRSCGSTIAISADDGLARLGIRSRACAVGQAAAAIFARHALGMDRNGIERASGEIGSWLAEEGPLPSWPDIEMLESAREFPARHPAVLLPWMAALDALSKVEAER